MKPWRQVTATEGPRSGRGGILGPDTSRRTRWWVLDLECGHHVERIVRYTPELVPVRAGGWRSRSADDVQPPPRRVRCDLCPSEP